MKFNIRFCSKLIMTKLLLEYKLVLGKMLQSCLCCNTAQQQHLIQLILQDK